jgi:hypothetical protein
MLVLRFVVNLVILAIEIGAVVAVAWIGLHYPLHFAAGAAALALVMGVVLERARLVNELPFYFGGSRTALSLIGGGIALAEGGLKALLAGLVALLTFSGTDHERLFWVAVIFGVCVFAGSSLLRRLSISFGAIPSRWGYFRLAAPLGLLFSAALSLLPAPTMTAVGRSLIFELPARPSLSQASETLFILKQKFDDIVVTLLSQFVGPGVAKAVGVLVSVNMLTGFVIGVFAVAIAEIVRRLENATP